jgi:hypothetical protein
VTDNNSSRAAKTLSATSTVADLLPQLAGVIAGVSALGLFAGWREISAYYSELGAPWISGMLSPSRVVERSAGLMGTIGLFTLLSVYWLSAETISERGLRRASIAALVVAGLFFSASVAPVGWFQNSTIYVFAILAAQVTAISAGLTVGELIAGLAERDLKWSGYHIWLLYCIVLFGLLQAPDRLGTAKAQFDSTPTSNAMPIVSTTVVTPGRVWRLVTTIESSFLVVALGAKREEHVFRVLAASEITEIKSSHAK